MPPVSSVPNDEIFDKYLQKAISEINELGDEIARAAGDAAVPVLGSGHPLADVLLLKPAPRPAEVQEGVAFYGRSGQAILKSLQRLTPTIEALHVPDIDESLDEQPAKTRFWNAFKTLGSWWAELPPY